MTINDPESSTFRRDREFATTRWSVVISAGHESSPDSARALASLCEWYWRPLYVFVRRRGYQRAEAEDLIQGFFLMLLQRDDLKKLHPSHGRFRSFLLAALKNYLLNAWDRERAQKRGGGQTVLSLDFDSAETALTTQVGTAATPELVFKRQWGLTLLAKVQDQLQQEMTTSGRGELYDALKPHFAGEPGQDTYADVATRYGMTVAAVKMAMKRLRKRYRELLRQEIAQTVCTNEEIDEEIRDLFDALSRRSL